MTDGSLSIQNACKQIFKNPIMLMCRYHMHQNLLSIIRKKIFFLMFKSILNTIHYLKIIMAKIVMFVA